MELVLVLRGAVAAAVLMMLVGGVPRIVQAGLAAVVGVWSAAVAGGVAGGLAAATRAASIGGLVVPAGGAAAAAGEAATGRAVAAGVMWLIAARELVIGATIGVMAAVPLLAVATAGRLVATASGLPGDARARGPYGALFTVLAAAVFVGIDGHVALVEGIVASFRAAPAVVSIEPRVLATLAGLLPSAVQLAVPWLVTAAVVEMAAGVAVRVAGRASLHAPIAAATPAALVMMTASLIGTLAVAIAALIRGTW